MIRIFPKTASCMAFNHQPIFFLMNSADNKSLLLSIVLKALKKEKKFKVEGCLSLDFEDDN